MAKTYATIEGSRQPKTCTGGNDGVRASVQSYDGSVITSTRYDDEGNLEVRIGTNDGSSPYTDWNSNDFYGTIEDVKSMIKLWNDVKAGRAKVIHHRKAR